MNRRQFIAGLAASTAPMVGVGTVLRDAELSWSYPPLPYKDPSAVLVEFHERLNAAYRRTNEAMAANIREQVWATDSGRPLRETLHGIS